RRGVLLPRLRLGAPVLAGGPRHAGDALPGGRAVRAAAGLSLLRLSADRRRRVGERRRDHREEPRIVSSSRHHAQLPGYPHGDRFLRHVPRPAREVRVRRDLPRRPPTRYPRIPAGEGREGRRRRGSEIPVSRSLPHPDQDREAARSRERLDGGQRTAFRALLRRIRHARDDAPRRLDAGPIQQRGVVAKVDGEAGAGGRRGKNPDFVPFVPAGVGALRGRHRRASRLHRGRDGAPAPRRELAAGVRRPGERRRHRARPPMTERIPTGITLHQKSRVLEIAFSDGRSFRLPYEFLRVYSPSAEVRGHGPGKEVLQTGKRAVEIRALEPVGSYAVQPVFSDGHSTGIYSWDYLYELGENQERMWADYLARLESAGAKRD